MRLPYFLRNNNYTDTKLTRYPAFRCFSRWREGERERESRIFETHDESLNEFSSLPFARFFLLFRFAVHTVKRFERTLELRTLFENGSATRVKNRFKSEASSGVHTRRSKAERIPFSTIPRCRICWLRNVLKTPGTPCARVSNTRFQ